MDSDEAPYSNAFADKGAGKPTCGNKRIRIGLATNNPLLGITAATADSALKDFVPAPTSQINTITNDLAPLGIRLDTSLPNLICPQVNVEIDQPIRDPLLSHVSTPNGRATAQRLIKNAVVVPVFNGLTAAANASAQTTATVGGVVQATAGGSVGASATLPPINLNPTLLHDQQRLSHLLDNIDQRVQNRLTTTGAKVDNMAGTVQGVTLGADVPSATGATSAAASGLSLTSCLKQSLDTLYNPPASDAPSSDEVMNQVLADAAKSGEAIQLIQVGAVPCPGANFDPTTQTFDCLQAATGSAAQTVTGLYDVPFFDVAPVVIKDVGGGNYQAIPVHATQAEGAFRASLVRDASDTRYDPSLPINQNPATQSPCAQAPAPQQTVLPTSVPTQSVPTPAVPGSVAGTPLPTVATPTGGPNAPGAATPTVLAAPTQLPVCSGATNVPTPGVTSPGVNGPTPTCVPNAVASQAQNANSSAAPSVYVPASACNAPGQVASAVPTVAVPTAPVPQGLPVPDQPDAREES